MKENNKTQLSKEEQKLAKYFASSLIALLFFLLRFVNLIMLRSSFAIDRVVLVVYLILSAVFIYNMFGQKKWGFWGYGIFQIVYAIFSFIQSNSIPIDLFAGVFALCAVLFNKKIKRT